MQNLKEVRVAILDSDNEIPFFMKEMIEDSIPNVNCVVFSNITTLVMASGNLDLIIICKRCLTGNNILKPKIITMDTVGEADLMKPFSEDELISIVSKEVMALRKI